MNNKTPLTKRIFLISNMWPDSISPGYGSFVKNVVEGLTEHGYTVTRTALIVGRPHSRKSKLRSYFSFYWNILKGFLQGGFDMVYIHFPNQATPVLRQLYRIWRPKTVVNYHGEDLLYEKGGYKEKLGRQTDAFLKKFVNRIVVPSEFFKDIVVRRGIASESDVIVSPSGGVVEDVFYPVSDSVADMPEVFNEKRPLRIGFVGRLEEEKGILDFMEGVRKVKDRGLAIKAIVVGYGSLESAAVDYMRDNGLENTVEFLGGLPQSQLGDYYRSLDLFVFPTRAPESLGLTGIEALASGIPVVGSNIGGVATYLKDGINGLLVEPGNIGMLTNRIEEFFRMTAIQRKKMRQCCIASGQYFYRKKVCKALSTSFDQLLNEK